ncbi:epsin-1 [Latimeria chalumnae]|uniref:epsin-1 n=1 Tax=Latimeria chalumnae TaxID=7897 RepID=UPI00313D7AF9
MSSAAFRRQVKNLVKNYSEAEIKVREATSNDPWGPSSSLMSEIADMTYNTVYFSEIMYMIWHRLGDQRRNWRHVYKALTLMEYLVKNGSERVALQCIECIFSIQILKEFQYTDQDGKDQGNHIRLRAKQLIQLLMDEQLLQEERETAKRTRQRMSQGMKSMSKASYSAMAVSSCDQDVASAEPPHQCKC